MAILPVGTANSGSVTLGSAPKVNITSVGTSNNGSQTTYSPQTTSGNPITTVSPQSTSGHSINQSPTYALGAVTNTPGNTENNTTTNGEYSDPYSQWGGATAFAALKSGFDNQKNALFDSAVNSAEAKGLAMRTAIENFLRNIGRQQREIDERGISNEMGLASGHSDILSMVNRGLRSGGVMLADRNATDSSAAQAIAEAYNELGTRQLNDIGNQYEMENIAIGFAQNDLDEDVTGGIKSIQAEKQAAITSIVNEANNQIAALDAAMANASMPERIAINSEINRIRTAVTNELGNYDNKLSNVHSINPMARPALLAQSRQRAKMGMRDKAPFNYENIGSGQLQETGPVATNLPIFTYGNTDKEY